MTEDDRGGVKARLSGGAHREGSKRSDLNQRQYCEAEDIPLKAFGDRRAKVAAS
jgi:hypothetical protein